MQRFDSEGQRARRLNADTEANAPANYKMQHKYFILRSIVRATAV